jgi:uncharacterized repeat protein (TIGR02543 family)
VGNVTSASTTCTLGSANATVTATYRNLPPTPTYTLTVNSGTGSGNYEAGTQVTITANTAPTGQTFDRWTGDTGGVDNVTSASTTCTLGSANATVTATYRNLPPAPTYTLTVNNGSGSGSYEAGTQVTITANAAPTGQTFDRWTGDTGGVGNVTSASTTYTLGSANATVTATYKNLPPTNTLHVDRTSLNFSSGGGSQTIHLSTNVTWTVSGDRDWVTVSPATGSNNATVTVTATAHAGTTSRSATVTVSGGGLTETVSIIQEGETAPVHYTVTFNADGGTPTPDTQTIPEGGRVAEPAPPTLSGFVFTGWYNGSRAWDFATGTVTSDLTLTAHWEIPNGKEAAAGEGFFIYSQERSLFVQSATGITAIEVFTASGQLVHKATPNASEITINGLPGGILIIRIHTKTGNTETRKMLL